MCSSYYTIGFFFYRPFQLGKGKKKKKTEHTIQRNHYYTFKDKCFKKKENTFKDEEARSQSLLNASRSGVIKRPRCMPKKETSLCLRKRQVFEPQPIETRP